MGAGLDQYTKLPTLTVKLSRNPDSPNIISVPLHMQQAVYSDFFDLKDQVDRLEGNLNKILERSASDLGGVVVDAYDYSRQQLAVTAWNSVLSATQTAINLLSFANSFRLIKTDREAYLEEHANRDKVGGETTIIGADGKATIIKNIQEVEMGKDLDSPLMMYKDEMLDGVKGLVTKWPTLAPRLANYISNLSEDELLLTLFYVSQRREIKSDIGKNEAEVEKLTQLRLRQVPKNVATAASLKKDIDSLIELISLRPDFDWQTEAKAFLEYYEAEQTYREQAGFGFRNALNSVESVRGEWIRKGKDWFDEAKANQILAGGQLKQMVENAPEDVKPVLQRLNEFYGEYAIAANEPPKLAEALLDREEYLKDLKSRLDNNTQYLTANNIPIDIVDFEVLKIPKISDLYNTLTDLKQIAATYDYLPGWAGSLGNLLVNAKNEGYDPDKTGPMLQEYVNSLYELGGGKMLEQEVIDDFVSRMHEVPQTQRPRFLMAEGAKYMPFYAEVSTDTVAKGIDSNFLPASPEVMEAYLYEEVINADKFDVFDMQKKVTEIISQARRHISIIL